VHSKLFEEYLSQFESFCWSSIEAGPQPVWMKLQALQTCCNALYVCEQ